MSGESTPMNVGMYAPPAAPATRRASFGLRFGLGLAAITALALALRLVWLWPPVQAATQAPYDDEGVYVMAAQLLRQGIWPYRDFFFAHPPLGVLALLPAVSTAYTPWGSALSFGLARLLMAAMGAATATVVGLAAARLWGTSGGTHRRAAAGDRPRLGRQ